MPADLSSSDAATPDVVLKVGGYAPQGTSHAAGLEVFADEVRRGTDHRIDVDILWNILDTGRPASDLLVMVEAGEFALCYFSTSYLGGRVAELNVLETPFLFDDLDQAHRALDGAFGAALSEATARSTGLQVLGYWDNGFRHLTNRIRPIHVVDDCRGMRVRMQPNAIHEAMILAWGAVPVAVDLGEAIELISSGKVDAQENPLANTVAYGVDRVHRFATMTGHLYGARGLFAHPDTLTALSGDRAVIEHAARTAILHQREVAARNELELRSRLEMAGMQFVDPTPDELATFREVTAPVVEMVRGEHGTALFELAAFA